MDMNILRGFPDSHEEPSVVIRQPPRESNCSKISPNHCVRGSISLASASGSENNGFSDSDPIDVNPGFCMAPSKRSRGFRQSLSLIGNGQSVEEQPDGKLEPTGTYPVDVEEEKAWAVINQEIFEWQYVCGTGRPYWWSPESMFNRSKSSNMQRSRFYNNEVSQSSVPDYDPKQRAVAETLLASPKSKDSAAHIIALQLLSSCFTLPPTSLHAPTPDYTSSLYVTDSRMISSLRMHTHYRYAPSFGHDARNPSPIEGWSSCEGTTRCPSPNTINKQVVALKNFKNGSQRSSKRRRHTKGRAFKHSKLFGGRSESVEQLSSEVLEDDPYRKAALALFDASSKQPKSGTPKTDFRMTQFEDGAVKHSATLRLNNPPNMKYSLQPVIRSEPHPVYIQPVRELAIKRWDSFRRNFGGSLHAQLPMKRSDERGSRTSESETSTALVSEGKLRRQRAQERGDIHSSVDNETPHNSPASSYQGSEATGSNLDFGGADCSEEMTESSGRESPGEALTTITSLERTSPKPTAGASNSSFASKLKRCRARRKSGLSEVLWPDDVINGDIVETEGRVNAGITGTGNPGLLKSCLKLTRARTSRSSAGSTIFTPDSESLTQLDQQVEDGHVSRSSMSGSQIFKVGVESVEIDGLPVGPSKHAWNAKGKNNEPTYL